MTEATGDAALRRASIVVMPLASTAVPGDAGLADGLTHDIIFGLAKLRSLRVIARGTAFVLRDRALTPSEAATLLGVDYLASGMVRREGARLVVRIELSAARSGQIIWADEFSIAAKTRSLCSAPSPFASSPASMPRCTRRSATARC